MLLLPLVPGGRIETLHSAAHPEGIYKCPGNPSELASAPPSQSSEVLLCGYVHAQELLTPHLPVRCGEARGVCSLSIERYGNSRLYKQKEVISSI